MPSDILRIAAAFLGASGVGLGAFGAHGLKNKLQQGQKMDNWRTAVMYQLFHAVAILSVSALCNDDDKSATTTSQSTAKNTCLETAGQCITLGTVLFSGSIYMLCLDIGPKMVLGPITPIGGLFMIAGWTMLGFANGGGQDQNNNKSN